VGCLKQCARHRRQHEKGDEEADTAIRDERAGKHYRKDCALVSKLLAHETGDGLHRPAVVHELSEQRTEQEYRKELRDELRRTAHERLRPVSEEGFSRGRRRNKRDSRGEQKDAPAAKRKPYEKPKGCENTKKTHASDLLQQNVEVDGRLLADVVGFRADKG